MRSAKEARCFCCRLFSWSVGATWVIPIGSRSGGRQGTRRECDVGVVLGCVVTKWQSQPAAIGQNAPVFPCVDAVICRIELGRRPSSRWMSTWPSRACWCSMWAILARSSLLIRPVLSCAIVQRLSSPTRSKQEPTTSLRIPARIGANGAPRRRAPARGARADRRERDPRDLLVRPSRRCYVRVPISCIRPSLCLLSRQAVGLWPASRLPRRGRGAPMKGSSLRNLTIQKNER